MFDKVLKMQICNNSSEYPMCTFTFCSYYYQCLLFDEILWVIKCAVGPSSEINSSYPLLHMHKTMCRDIAWTYTRGVRA